MKLKRLLNGATALAVTLVPGLALAAAPVSALVSPVHITPVGVVDLAQLAGSAVNHRALGMSQPLEMLRLKYPTANGMARAAPLSRAGQPNVDVVAAARSVTISGFNGSYDGQLPGVLNYELEPPDQGLAVNNGTVVENVNNVMQIFNSSGKSLLGPISDYALFNLTESNAPILSDPHVEYDASVGRWFIEEVIALSNGFNGFALAVSQTSNPGGKYYVYQIDDLGSQISACGGSCLADYPQPGYDANAYYIDADLFSNTSGGFVDAAIYAIPKAALISGQSVSYDAYLLPEFVLQPAIPAVGGKFATEANGTEFFLSAQQILYGTNTLSVWSLSNTGLVGTTTPPTAYNTILTSEAYTSTVAATEPNDVGPYGLSVGATTSPQLDGGYNSFGGGAKYLNGALYAALTTGTTDSKGLAVNELAWFKVGVTATSTSVGAKISSQGYVVPPTGYSIQYPAFALAPSGSGVIALSVTNPNAAVPGGYPSTGFVPFQNGAPGTTLKVTGQGTASDDGFTGYNGAGPAGIGRWGDYATATSDPTTGGLYIANEYIPSATTYPRGSYANWGTFITSVK